MVNLPEKSLFLWEIFTYGNITMASMIKNTHAFTELISYALNKARKPVLGKFPTIVKISMIISNSEGRRRQEEKARGKGQHWATCTVQNFFFRSYFYIITENSKS
jgi:hypothetical protein